MFDKNCRQIIILIFAICFTLIFSSTNLNAKGKKPPKEKKAEDTQKVEIKVADEQKLKEEKDASIQPLPASSTVQTSAQLTALKKISLQEAKQIFDENKALFIDGRASSAFATRRIPGAFNCTLGEFDVKVIELKQKTPLDTLLIVYCGGETCNLANRISAKLVEQGYKNVLIFSGGWPAWAQANYPMEP